MKLQSLAVAAVVAVAALGSPSVVSAAECTNAEQEALAGVDGSAVAKACPSLFSDEEDSLNPTRIEALTAAALKAIEPCKQPGCLTELKDFVSKVPDCSVSGLNVKATYTASVTLCEAFSAGEVTVAKAKEIFKEVTKNITNAVESLLGGSGADEEESGSVATELPTVTTAEPNATTSEETPVATKPAEVPSPAATTPAPTTKSGSSASTVAGLAVVATATLVSTLLL